MPQTADKTKRRHGGFSLFIALYAAASLIIISFFMIRLYGKLVSYENAYRNSLPEVWAADIFSRITAGDTGDIELFYADGSSPGTDTFDNAGALTDYICSKNGTWDKPYGTDPGKPLSRTAGEVYYFRPLKSR